LIDNLLELARIGTHFGPFYEPIHDRR